MTRLAIAAVLALAAAAPLGGQTVRATGVTSLQFIQLRPLVIDSVPVAEAPGNGLIRRTADGRLVRCVAGDRYCRYTRSADRQTVAPLIQDVNVSAWGLGRGLRLYAQIRTRTSFGGEEELWPRAEDRFDALSAFIELDRGRFRLRGGRQWKTSGLGYYNFDGGSALYRALPGLTLELFGGWSLARNLNEPRTSDAIAAIETFAPDKRALLIGGQVRYRPTFAFSAGALYQREVRDDRFGLYSERVALDAAWRHGRGSVTGTLEADAAAEELNDARLTASYRIREDLTIDGYARLYEPFFELWTIWGAFDPVGFREVGGGGTWRSSGTRAMEITAQFSRRSYADVNASTVFGEYRSDGWNLGLTGSFRASPEWLVQGAYRVDLGFGAARGEATIRVQRDLPDDAYIAASAIGFERQFELRVAEGTVYGAGVDGHVRLGARSGVTGSLAGYRHFGNDGAPDVDWSQFRGMLRFEWTVGPEPGVVSARGGRR
jgi:hypothetical protein